jgi:hypothetical protein
MSGLQIAGRGSRPRWNGHFVQGETQLRLASIANQAALHLGTHFGSGI